MAKTTSPERGALLLTISKFFTIVAGYAIYFGLARILGPELFGVYGVVIGIISVLNMVVIRGTLQSVSKFVSENPELGEAVKRKSLKMALFLGGTIFLIYELGASVIARILNDTALTPYIRLAGLIFLSYAFYAVIMGFVNGMRQFFRQAVFEITYNAFKVILILTLAFLGFSVMGAISGFAAAAFLIFIISFIIVGLHEPKGEIDTKALMHFNLIVMGIAFVQNLLLQFDLFAVKALSPAATSNLLGGYYTAVLSIARLPYYAVISLSFVIFPLISYSTFSRDKERTVKYINEVMRYSLIILVGIVVLFSGDASNIISLLYSATYKAGAPALAIALFGLLAYSLLYITTTIITAGGKPKLALIICVVTLILDALANYLLVPRYQLIGAASASAVAFFIGLFLSGFFLLKDFSAFIPISSTLRVSLIGAALYAISLMVPLKFPLWIGKMALLCLLYGALLIIFGEFKKTDLERVLRMVKG